MHFGHVAQLAMKLPVDKRDAPDIRPDNLAFLISVIRPDTKLVSRISGRISGKAGCRISG
jgi:hypothetical protein